MPACQFAVPETLDSLLAGFRAGDREQSEQFVKAVTPTLRRIARRFLPQLPDDIQSELVGETLLLILQPGMTKFNPRRADASRYIYGFALNAVKAIRKQYGAVRVVQRVKGSQSAPSGAPVKIISIEELSNELKINIEGGLHDRVAAEQLLDKASPIVHSALKRMHFGGEPQVRVAASLNIDRFALQRQIVAFAHAVSSEMRLCA